MTTIAAGHAGPKPLVALALAAVLSLGGCKPSCAGGECPSVESLRDYRPPEATRVYAVDGSLLGDLSAQRRIVVDLAQVPAVLRDGMVAVEDRRFWEHDGVDMRGVARAVIRNVFSLSFSEGFSTITMQLARNVFPTALPRAKQLRRKYWEVVLARQIENEFTKEEILGLYLNQIYLGDGLYGVEAAARGYFGKPSRELSPPEAAMLIALAKNPNGYDPRHHPRIAVERRNLVLAVMAREGVIDPESLDRFQSAPLRLAPPAEAAGEAPYFVAAVRRELRDRFGATADVMGLRVYTGLDPDIQRAARDALLEQIERIEAGRYGRFRHPVPDSGDLSPATGAGSPYLQGMVVVMDPSTGAVRALVGGRDFGHSQYDRALQARRQPGSAFKAIVYAAALEAGLTVTTRVDVSPVELSGASGTWRPSDHVDTTQAMPVRQAVALSSNNAAVRVGRWVGEDHVIRTARSLGIGTPMQPYPSIHLGAAEVVPAALVAAYAAFGNGGREVSPRLITRLESGQGRVLWTAPPASAQAIDPRIAWLTLNLLQGVIDEGTGRVIRDSGFWLPAAGKTGTTNDNKDAWFVGMTPDLAAGVWIGFDRPQTIAGNAGGGALAAPVWATLMNRVYAERPAPAGWMPPDGLAAVPVDRSSGMLATDDCPLEQVHVEYFLPGTEPREYCPLHGGSVERFFERLWRGMKSAI
ncbi:MAG TPA: PBP1A family penicillin-binding protein [Longimicrobiales bacterium]|nr:PBP1A family penicillin-binding protein [Longimicrobiales bacterium]